MATLWTYSLHFLFLSLAADAADSAAGYKSVPCLHWSDI